MCGAAAPLALLYTLLLGHLPFFGSFITVADLALVLSSFRFCFRKLNRTWSKSRNAEKGLADVRWVEPTAVLGAAVQLWWVTPGLQ